jgi:AbrB family looped-hinge helix DNA binding protein
METTIDASGRLVIPKEVRREAGLLPGVRLVVRAVEGQVLIEPAPRPVRLVRRGRLTIARPAGKSAAPKLTAAAVEKTVRSIRRRG